MNKKALLDIEVELLKKAYFLSKFNKKLSNFTKVDWDQKCLSQKSLFHYGNKKLASKTHTHTKVSQLDLLW